MPKEVHEQFNFLPYIHKVLQQVHPDSTISTEAINELNLLTHNLAERLINESTHLAKTNNKKTISSREIQTAVRVCLPGELAKHAVSEGTKAVTKYTSSVNIGTIPRQSRAGLQFAVGRTEALIRQQSSIDRIGSGAPVYLAAVLEYITAEILELAGNAARENKVKRISPRHLQLAIRNDEELAKLFREVTLSGGVLQNINYKLLPRWTPKTHSAPQY